MSRRLLRPEIHPKPWPALAALAAGLSFVAGGRAALCRIMPTPPTSVRATPAATDEESVRDARTLAVELMALSAFCGKMEGQGMRSPAASAAFLREWQWNEDRGRLPSHPHFGGTGRRRESAPDLLSTALMLQAMRASGVAASDPYIWRASVFIARCQVTGDPRAGDDGDRGGFLAGPVVDAAGGASRVRLGHPTGAATCLGLTSLLAAGAAPDDPRVRDAVRWLEGHYALDSHPGMVRPREGLYGYYYEFARAMTALGRDRIRDSRGVVHNWRAELGRTLAGEQKPDGSWTNPDESREPASSSASTITSLALLTLRQIRP